MSAPRVSIVRRCLGRFVKTEYGAATIEFVIMFPLVVSLVLSTVESGVLLLRFMMMERALDLSMRDIRLATGEDVTHDAVRDAICANAAMFPNCQAVMKVELVPVDTVNWTMASSDADCIDRGSTDEIVYNFNINSQSNQVMFVRACVVVDPWFPTTGLGLALNKDASGGFRMVSYSAFVYEPVRGEL